MFRVAEVSESYVLGGSGECIGRDGKPRRPLPDGEGLPGYLDLDTTVIGELRGGIN